MIPRIGGTAHDKVAHLRVLLRVLAEDEHAVERRTKCAVEFGDSIAIAQIVRH